MSKEPEVSRTQFMILKSNVNQIEGRLKCLEYGGHEWIATNDLDVSRRLYFCRNCNIEHYSDKSPVVRGTVQDLDDHIAKERNMS